MQTLLKSARTLGDLAEAALEAGLSGALDEPASIILKGSKVPGVLRSTLVSVLKDQPEDSLRVRANGCSPAGT